MYKHDIRWEPVLLTKVFLDRYQLSCFGPLIGIQRCERNIELMCDRRVERIGSTHSATGSHLRGHLDHCLIHFNQTQAR